jgi:hypothetical protein
VVEGVTTRIVEEREWKGGKLYEVARNFFAICPRTKDVFYFGEEVDFYKDDKITGHEGTWLAGKNGARAGLIMPGEPKVGMRYYQEIARASRWTAPRSSRSTTRSGPRRARSRSR